MTARLLLDPAGYDYYFAGLLMATAVTERLSGLLPWRTGVLYVGVTWADSLFAPGDTAALRLIVLSSYWLPLPSLGIRFRQLPQTRAILVRYPGRLAQR